MKNKSSGIIDEPPTSPHFGIWFVGHYKVILVSQHDSQEEHVVKKKKQNHTNTTGAPYGVDDFIKFCNASLHRFA